MAITQAEIDALIQFIDETETAESVTNVIVAAVLRFLNERTKAIEQAKATTDDLEAETEARVEADEDLQASIAALADRINALVIDGGLKPEDIINSSTSTAADKALAAAQGYVLRRNVVAIQEKLDALIEALANSAFSTGRVSILGSLSWGAPVSYTISQTLSGCTSSQNGNTIDGSIPLTIELTPNMGKILKVSDVIVTVAGGGSAMVTRDSSTGKVTVYVAVVTGAVSISASASVPRGYLVTRNLTHCSSSNTGNAFELSQYETVLTADSGYSLTGVTPVVTMGGVNVTSQVWNASTRTITIPVVTGDIVITATAEESHNPQVSFFLRGCDVVGTQPAEVESGSDLTVTLRKNSSTWPSGEQGGEVAPAQEDFLARDIIVYVGGVPATFSTSQSAANGDISVTVQNVTDDVLISNIVWTAERINSGKTAFIQVGASYVVRYRGSSMIPIGGATSLSVVNNDGNSYGTGNSQLGVLFYDQNETFIQCVNSQGHKVMKLTVPSNARYLRMAGNNWYVPKDSNGYGSGGSNTTGIDYAFYIYDDVNGKFVWKGTYVTETINTDNEPTE